MNKICSIVTLTLGAIGVFSGILTVVFYSDLYHYIMKMVSPQSMFSKQIVHLIF